MTAVVSGLHQSSMTPSHAPVAAHVVLTVFVNALILQRMALTIRSVEFPVPGGLGMQESGYVLVDNRTRSGKDNDGFLGDAGGWPSAR